MKKTKQTLAVLLALLLACLSFGAVHAETTSAITKADALHTQGKTMVNQKGEEVFLRGVNLGGWLI